MATYERPQDGLEGFDFEAYAPDPTDVDNLFMNVLARHNEQVTEAGASSEALEWNEQEYELPCLAARGIGNEIALQVKKKDSADSKHFRLGHFSPVTGIVIYPDFLVSDEEQNTLVSAASSARNKEIDIFNRRPEKSARRLDYEHPDIRDLHFGHQEVLAAERIVLDALYNLNANLKTNNPRQRTELDDYSEAAICVLPNSGGFAGTQVTKDPEHYLGLRLVGWYYEEDGVKRRPPAKIISLAQRNPKPKNQNDFIPVERLVGQDEINTLVGLYYEVIVAAQKLKLGRTPLELDKKELAVVRHPMPIRRL